MSDWQPIATAPKDGTVLLLCVRGFTAAIGQWFTHPKLDYPRWISFDPEGMFESDQELIDHLNSSSYDPTHWMPLPEPPKP